MNIKMLKTEKGSINGITNQEYIEGVEYPLGGSPRELELARAFVKAGLAEEVVGKKVVITASAPVAPPTAEASVPADGDGDAGEVSSENAETSVAEQGGTIPAPAAAATVPVAAVKAPKVKNAKAAK